MAAPPALGALGLTFTAMRGMQAVSLITIIGLTSNFISEMVVAGYETPSALVGTLVVVRPPRRAHAGPPRGKGREGVGDGLG